MLSWLNEVRGGYLCEIVPLESERFSGESGTLVASWNSLLSELPGLGRRMSSIECGVYLDLVVLQDTIYDKVSTY